MDWAADVLVGTNRRWPSLRSVGFRFAIVDKQGRRGSNVHLRSWVFARSAGTKSFDVVVNVSEDINVAHTTGMSRG